MRIIQAYAFEKGQLKRVLGTRYSTDLLDALFSYPIITSANLADRIGRHRNTAAHYLNKLVKAGILTDSWYGKYHLYIHAELLSILDQQ